MIKDGLSRVTGRVIINVLAAGFSVLVLLGVFGLGCGGFGGGWEKNGVIGFVSGCVVRVYVFWGVIFLVFFWYLVIMVSG